MAVDAERRFVFVGMWLYRVMGLLCRASALRGFPYRHRKPHDIYDYFMEIAVIVRVELVTLAVRHPIAAPK